MTRDLRIREHHRLAFDRGQEVCVLVDGRPVRAYTKEPLAVALFAAGRRVLARSLKFHRPRGAFCLAGQCHSCLMTVDGKPSVRTCRTYPRDGMVVRSQGGFPKVTNDLLFAADFLFPKGLDYHALLTRPGFAHRLFVQAVRRMASGARLPAGPPTKPGRLSFEDCDVAVIGAGPAGVAAALGAAGGGRRVVLIDEEPEPGGRLCHETEEVELPGGEGPAPGQAFARNFLPLLQAAGVEFRGTTLAAGYYEDGVLALVQGDEMTALSARRIVVCTGAMDQNAAFPGNDLPNILSARALRRLTNLYGVCPAVQAFLVGTNHDALSLALRLPEIGVRVAGLVEPGDRIRGPGAMADEVQRRGVPIFLGYHVAGAIGRFHLKGIRIAPVAGGERLRFPCDLVAVAERPAPAFHLLDQLGCPLRYRPERGGFVTDLEMTGRTPVPHVFAAGEVTGEEDLGEIVRRGRIAGLSAALDLADDPARRAERDRLIGEAA